MAWFDQGDDWKTICWPRTSWSSKLDTFSRNIKIHLTAFHQVARSRIAVVRCCSPFGLKRNSKPSLSLLFYSSVYSNLTKISFILYFHLRLINNSSFSVTLKSLYYFIRFDYCDFRDLWVVVEKKLKTRTSSRIQNHISGSNKWKQTI